MIGYLEGSILEKGSLERNEEFWIVGVGAPAQGRVGYRVSVPRAAAYAECSPGDRVCLFIHTHVREDALDLYGFLTTLERQVFLALMMVSGIGPRVGLAALSEISASGLIRLILEKDKAALSRVPGIGKKTAERVVLELYDRAARKVQNGVWQVSSDEREILAAGGLNPRSSGAYSQGFEELREALQALGYREAQVAHALLKLQGMEREPGRKLEDWVRLALRQLN